MKVHSPDPFNLDRFLEAQERIYDQALAEIRAVRKQSHWSWFIFPQISGLGFSSRSMRYGIESLAEARAYLQHRTLGPRLKECVAALLELPVSDAELVLGHIDAMKLRSCLTLFSEADPDESVFDVALQKYYHGFPDKATLSLIATSP